MTVTAYAANITSVINWQSNRLSATTESAATVTGEKVAGTSQLD
jgi:hypothetical protein